MALGVEVEPSRLELTISPEEPTQGTLKLNNLSGRAVQVQVTPGAYRSFLANVSLPSAEGWFLFEPNVLTMAPKASSNIQYIIQPPANLRNDTAGEYLAAILIDEFPIEKEVPPPAPAVGDRILTQPWGTGTSFQPSETETPTPPSEDDASATRGRLTIVPRFAMPVYLKIRGRERIAVEVTNVSVQSAKTSDLLAVEVTLVNRGTVHVRPGGNLAILDSDGRPLTAYPLGKALPLLPTATMTIPTLIPLPDSGRYKALVTIEVQTATPIQKEVPFEVDIEGRVMEKEGE